MTYIFHYSRPFTDYMSKGKATQTSLTNRPIHGVLDLSIGERVSKPCGTSSSFCMYSGSLRSRQEFSSSLELGSMNLCKNLCGWGGGEVLRNPVHLFHCGGARAFGFRRCMRVCFGAVACMCVFCCGGVRVWLWRRVCFVVEMCVSSWRRVCVCAPCCGGVCDLLLLFVCVS